VLSRVISPKLLFSGCLLSAMTATALHRDWVAVAGLQEAIDVLGANPQDSPSGHEGGQLTAGDPSSQGVPAESGPLASLGEGFKALCWHDAPFVPP
jgi:hypothetical protein